MNLAVVTPYPPVATGIAQYGYYVAGALAQSSRFSQITLLTQPAGSRPAPAFPLPAGIRRVSAWRPEGIGTGLRLLAHIDRLRPDLVWFNLGATIFGRSPLANLSGFLAPALCRRSGIPVVVTLHELVAQADLCRLGAPGGRLAGLGARLITGLGAHADVVCVTLKRQAEWFARDRPNLPVAHIPHGTFQPPELLPESSGQELLFFTHHAPFKGLEVLLEAYRLLTPSLPDLRLLVAGEDHARYPGYLQGIRAKYSHLPGVCWLGPIPEAGLRDLFARAKVVALPYLATTGSSSVLYRAAAWGRSVVCSDLPELRAAAAEAGLQVEFHDCGDATSLARALERLLRDRRLRFCQVRQNFQVVTRYSLEATSMAYLRAFSLALTRRAGPRSAWVLREPREIV